MGDTRLTRRGFLKGAIAIGGDGQVTLGNIVV